MAASIAEEFDPKRFASVDPPFFIRKVDRSGHWRLDDTISLDERIDTAADEVFPNENGRVSVFKVETADDLCRIAIGINSGRSRLHEELRLLCFKPEELNAARIRLEASLGDTSCYYANSCHYDIFHQDRAIRDLIGALFSADRELSKLKKKAMLCAEEYAESIGCRAANTDLAECLCADQIAE